MNERCPDHSEDEAPRMCACTRDRIKALRTALQTILHVACGEQQAKNCAATALGADDDAHERQTP